MTKSQSYLVSQPSKDTFSIFNTIDARAHRARARTVTQVLSSRSIQHFDARLEEEVDVFIQKLYESCGRNGMSSTAVNISEACQKLALNAVGHLSLGYSLNLQRQTTHLPFQRALKLQSFMFNVFLQKPILKEMLSPLLAVASYFGCQDPFLRTLRDIIKSRQADDKDGKHDLYSIARETIGPTDIFSECGLLIIAGV